MIENIRKIAHSWLQNKEVECFIGYKHTDNNTFSPICIYDADDVEQLDFGEGCYHNLMSYFDLSGNTKTGILLKGCDGRAFVQLIAEGILNRESVKVLGVGCMENRISKSKCGSCYGLNPPVFDEMIQASENAEFKEPLIYEQIREIENLSEMERSDYFLKEFSRCIRCYACRQVCPLCYCEECISEKSDPQWVEVSVKTSSNYYWNMIRAYHMAGRCIGCGECSRVCPSQIPLNLLHGKLAMEIEKLSGYIPGFDIAKSQLDLDFKKEK